MTWSAYEIFSVISGLILICAALLPGLSAKDRLQALFGGACFVGYGFFVAGQSSGTYEFPVIIFVLPFAVLGYVGYKAYKWWNGESAQGNGRR